MSKTHPERELFQQEIARLTKLEKLVPDKDDVEKYGLTFKQLMALYIIMGVALVPDDIQLVITTLGKRKAEKPGKLFRLKDLIEFVAVMAEDDDGAYTRVLFDELKKLGVIKINRKGRVSIEI